MESGSLREQGTGAVLRRLGTRGATGCLRITEGPAKAALWLRDGAVYTARAPEARTRLGDRLVGAGIIDQSQLDGVLAEQAASPQRRRIGELLVERGMIDRETLRGYVQAQILDSVSAALRWREGTWAFTPGEQVAEDAPLDMTFESLLMDATRRLEEWETILAELGSLDAVVDFAPGTSGPEVALTPDEWSLLTRIDGAVSVADIAELTGYGQFETARIVYGLLTAGVVRLLADDATPPEVDREALLAEYSALEDLGGGPAPTRHGGGRGLLGRFRKG